MYILEGLGMGLVLAVSLGPIFFALTQTSIEEGVLPGLTVGLGIWISDLLIVTLYYLFIYEIKDSIESENFKFWMGISGAIVMTAFGLFLMVKKPVLDYSNKKHNYKNYIGFWLKGFLINTINPFTIVFWLSIISTYIIGRKLAATNTIVMLTTILIVIVLSDTGKVFLANSIKKMLTPKHVATISNLSGVILILFGIVMAYRVI